METVYTYVSTRACYDPVKTIFVFPPSEHARDCRLAEQFAIASGWRFLAEYDGAVLVIPVISDGWEKESTALPGELYDRLRGSFSSRNGKSLLGRGGKLWCWETMIYIAGYGDGAEFAGNCVVAHPNRFAAAALIGGAPRDFEAGDLPSSHWLVGNVSGDYAVKNNQIPSCLWLLGAAPEEERRTLDYFQTVNQLGDPQEVSLEGIPAWRRQSPKNPAWQLLISEEEFQWDLSLARAIQNGLFDRVIRWKNGPDGTLKMHPGRTGFYASDRFLHEKITVNGLDYPYAIHIPEGKTREEAAGLPLVISLHGRGEPAWLFAEKNGWDTLADETGEFVLAAPDSPGNIWQMGRDGETVAAMVRQILDEYGLDTTRVYLTGFSNGAMFTRQMGAAYPELFAGISPWNGPVHVPGFSKDEEELPLLLKTGYELPCFLYVGDNDPAAGLWDVQEQLEILLKANHCSARRDDKEPGGFVPDEIRAGRDGYADYAQGDRFYTRIYYGPDKEARVGFTVMKNMPHGAIEEESRAAWEFLKRFRRPRESREVVLNSYE